MAASRTIADHHRSPVLSVTKYDRISSPLIAIVVALVVAVISLFVVWTTTRDVSTSDTAPLELVELAGGVEDGSTEETFELESPAEESLDPSLAEVQSEEPEIQEMLESVVDLADQATSQAQEQFELDARDAGNPGSSEGSGQRALGMGPGESGLPRSQRWFVQFSDRISLDEYAQQLDALGIQLAVLRSSGTMIYLSDLTSRRPKTRQSKSGKGENRLYMTWQGGNRRDADLNLFSRAGIRVGNDLIMHFYSPQTEATLARLEKQYRNRSASEIRRTYFIVQRGNGGYRFAVTRQTYFR